MKYKITEKKLENILDAIRPFQDQDIEPEFILMREPETIASSSFSNYSLNQAPVVGRVEFDYNYSNLVNITAALIADFNMYAFDSNHKTALLKNTTHEGTLLIDGIKRYLDDYLFLKTIPVTEKEVVFQFKDPLDVPKIIDTIKETFPNAKFETQTNKGNTRINYIKDNQIFFSLSAYSLNFPYNECIGQGNFKNALIHSTEFVTRIHQDVLFKYDIKKIDMHEYQPIFKMMSPDKFSQQLGIRLDALFDELDKFKILESKMANETKASKYSKAEKRRYALRKSFLPLHVDYIIISPDTKEYFIRFGPNLNHEKIDELIKQQKLTSESYTGQKLESAMTIKKGGGQRVIHRAYNPKSRLIKDDQGDNIAVIQGNNIIKIPVKNVRTYDASKKFVNAIYDNWLFITNMVNTAELKSDLSLNERSIINSMDYLVKIYNFFIKEDIQKGIFAQRSKESSDGLVWIIRTMGECTKHDIKYKTLYVLNSMSQRIDPKNFRSYGESESKAIELYSNLQKLKGRFEAECGILE